MKAVWKKSVAAALAGMVALTASGCGSGGNKAAASKDCLKVGVYSFAASLEPADSYCSRAVVRYGIGETLTRFDGKMVARPWLAESWKMADDKLTWTFRISDRAVFSNGNKVTGDAVAKSLLRTFEKADRAKAMFRFDFIKGDGQDVIIKTKHPVPILPGILGDPLFLIADTSVENRDFAKMGPIGTGPYVVQSFSREKVVLAANEKGGRYLKQVTREEICGLPIITNINKELQNCPEIQDTIEKDILASDIWNLAVGRDLYQHSDFVECVRIFRQTP